MGLNEIQLQITGLNDPEAAIAEFMTLFDLWPEGVVAKVPFTAQTLVVLERLDQAIPLTFTTGYAAAQAVIAKSKNARYIAPYYGRLLEQDQDADRIVDDMLAISRPHTRVLVASLRSAQQVTSLAARGHNTFTLTPSVFAELLNNTASFEATAQFEAAAAKLESFPITRHRFRSHICESNPGILIPLG